MAVGSGVSVGVIARATASTDSGVGEDGGTGSPHAVMSRATIGNMKVTISGDLGIEVII